LIHPTVWPQYTNVTDRQTGQTDRPFYKRVAQKPAQPNSVLGLAIRFICPWRLWIVLKWPCVSSNLNEASTISGRRAVSLRQLNFVPWVTVPNHWLYLMSACFYCLAIAFWQLLNTRICYVMLLPTKPLVVVLLEKDLDNPSVLLGYLKSTEWQNREWSFDFNLRCLSRLTDFFLHSIVSHLNDSFA